MMKQDHFSERENHTRRMVGGRAKDVKKVRVLQSIRRGGKSRINLTGRHKFRIRTEQRAQLVKVSTNKANNVIRDMYSEKIRSKGGERE